MNANIQQRRSPQDTTYYDVCRPTVQRTVINRHRDEQLRLLNLGLRLNKLSVPCGRCGYDRTGPVACDWCGHVTLRAHSHRAASVARDRKGKTMAKRNIQPDSTREIV